MVSFTIKEIFQVSAKELYEAWLNSEIHSEMTGGEAICSNTNGENFTAWDGYISGKNIKLVPYSKIVQSWKTTEFSDKDDDSILELIFEQTEKGTELILKHSNIPIGQTQYKQGWIDHYFSPMNEYFKNK